MKHWFATNWRWLLLDLALAALAIFLLARFVFIPPQHLQETSPPVDWDALRAAGPQSPQEWEDTLHGSISAAADYLIAYQLSNGDMPYAILATGNSHTEPTVYIRQSSGAGSLYLACRIAEDTHYCEAGDAALALYLERIVTHPDMPGACFEDRGMCWLGGNGIFIDMLYKRWQATGETTMGDTDLGQVAFELGQNMAWMRWDDGAPVHAADPFTGMLDYSHDDPYFPGESQMAFLELYEMTGERYWLEQADLTNRFMLEEAPSDSHWHAHALNFRARLDGLSPADIERANAIGEAFIEGFKSQNSGDSATAIATRVEGLSALALALRREGEAYDWLIPTLQDNALYVMSHQLPAYTCPDWFPNLDFANVAGGIYSQCKDATIQVDGQFHWINGAANFLELLQGEE